MLGIASVSIKGFQSHIDSNFKLSPGLTVITGPSDAGKTAAIRALRWIAFNEPQGEAFLHTVRNTDGSVKSAVDRAEVTVEFENGVVVTKTRRKGKTTYTHSLYPEPWEKAEVPQEIKDTIGLLKQTYGDFETCLNFAFQLDPPFLLSETGSVGAKVLGKLAGTEVVDRAIGAVNKQTHHVRTDISQAEKTIGQLDVELLEYLEVDTLYTDLETLEKRFTTVENQVAVQKVLLDLNNSYTGLVERRTSLYERLQPLECVGMLLTNLSAIDRAYDRQQLLDTLATSFWKAVEVSRVSRQTINGLTYITGLQDRLRTLVGDYSKLEQLNVLCKRHEVLQTNITCHKAAIDASSSLLERSQRVTEVSKAAERLDSLNSLAERHRIAVDARIAITGRISTLQTVDGLKDTVVGVTVSYDILELLQGLVNAYRVAEADRLAKVERVYQTGLYITVCENELTTAWSEAGGVCPLCGQSTEREDQECTH